MSATIEGDPSLATDPPFVTWWRSTGSHKFPEELMDALAVAFADGWLAGRSHLRNSLEDHVEKAVKDYASEIAFHVYSHVS
jgi:hypothetical protein